ncbi:sodium:solute symporter family protein [Methanotrichaceae archaeon M04Ac]|uniref:Sodium:solute symporter family protein n=1 Tax=Candidatus Methanocrinis alkalitolerans TaxID=3033395 RepID=A0ABT5XD29_9EURY|nr:sodium:solute symporter family protein [Candidatus Methanocrinis alkalitolerans]MDF0592625.1 sodium:solute symporter family protein [Candidatus Methanocrinis alkalitolerans]
MDSYHLFLLLLGLYIAVLIGIGLRSSRGQRSVVDFWLAGREIGTANVGLSAAASWLTASALLLATGLFLSIGIGSIWVWVFPNVAGLLIIALIAKRVKKIPAMTQPELLEIRYHPIVRAPVAIAIAVTMILFAVTDFIGFKLVLSAFFGVPPHYAVMIMAVAVSIYVSLGGFRAVVWTDALQFTFLAGVAVAVAILATKASIDGGATLAAASASLGADWWNLFILGGLTGALVLQLALLPGWVAEQDPWQKIWAARDDGSARRGLVLGAVLLAVVYLACLVTAVALRTIYPIPGGEIEAEILYLSFIQESLPGAAVAVVAIGFAAASMSCADTFATSGASCISRDIVQRHMRPQATMKEMLVINRVLVIVMIAIAAAVALRVDSIVEAVIIATVIGTTSYFFPIIGGLFWKRATRWGALAAVIVGGGTQIGLISYEKLILKAPLETAAPKIASYGLLAEHGVLIGLSLSALVFVGISLATARPEAVRLAPFFDEVGREVYGEGHIAADRTDPEWRRVTSRIEEKISGDRAHLHLRLDVGPLLADGGKIEGELHWNEFLERLEREHPAWFELTGKDTLYRLTQADMLASVKMVRGDRLQIWLSAEPNVDLVERQKDEIYISWLEIEETLLGLGLSARAASR